MRELFFLFLLSQSDPSKLLRDFRTAIAENAPTTAADAADKLDQAIRARYQAWLVRDAPQRVDEFLSWLPADTETFWVNQEPFLVNLDERPEAFFAKPIQRFSTDRLAAAGDGRIYKALTGRTIRMVASGAKGYQENREILNTPGPRTPPTEVVYFYLLNEPFDAPPPDETIENRPVWKAPAKIMDWSTRRPGQEHPKIDDDNWIALARPDLLILANRREVLSALLVRIGQGAESRALPASLVEWKHVNRAASFWGLRHYSASAKPKAGERGYEAAELPRADGSATGASVQFDQSSLRLEIEYLSAAPLTKSRGPTDHLRTEFQVDQPSAGVWRLTSDVKARGQYPVLFAMQLLGYGEYR
jgi:hypothetical protein